MTTIALKKYLVSRINLLDDDFILDEIKSIVDKSESTVYVLSEEQIKSIEISRQQILDGDFYTQEEVDKIMEEWLNKK